MRPRVITAGVNAVASGAVPAVAGVTAVAMGAAPAAAGDGAAAMGMVPPTAGVTPLECDCLTTKGVLADFASEPRMVLMQPLAQLSDLIGGYEWVLLGSFLSPIAALLIGSFFRGWPYAKTVGPFVGAYTSLVVVLVFVAYAFRIGPPLCLGLLLMVAGLPVALGCLLGRKPEPPAGHCRKCGYNLTGNASGICPECGAPTG